MEESNEPSQIQKELLEIISLIHSAIKNKENKILNIQINEKKDLEKRIKTLPNEFQNRELELFTFFLKQLFLDENEEFDFDFEILKLFMEDETIDEIFAFLTEYISKNNFLDFLLKLGELFSKMYFEQDNLDDIINEFEHKELNNYECLLKIFSKCKKRKEIQYFLGNYDIYYKETYLIEIKLKLIYSLSIYFKLCVFGQKYEDLPIFNEDEENTITNSGNDKERISNLEKIILKNLEVFWSNSNFLFNLNMDIFMNIFYDFITQKSPNGFILNNTFDEPTKNYLDYMYYGLMRLFREFDEDALKKFCLDLFDFLDDNRNKKIKFVDRALRIGKTHNLKNDEIGLISFICINKKFITDLEKIAVSNPDKICSNEFIEQIISEKALSHYEILIMGDIFDEISSKNSQDEISDEKNNTNYIIEYKDENDAKNNSLKKLNENKQLKENNKTKIEIEYGIFADDPKYKREISYKKLLDKKIKEFEEHLDNIFKQTSLKIDSLNKKKAEDFLKFNLKIK